MRVIPRRGCGLRSRRAAAWAAAALASPRWSRWSWCSSASQPSPSLDRSASPRRMSSTRWTPTTCDASPQPPQPHRSFAAEPAPRAARLASLTAAASSPSHPSRQARTINNQLDWECGECSAFNFARVERLGRRERNSRHARTYCERAPPVAARNARARTTAQPRPRQGHGRSCTSTQAVACHPLRYAGGRMPPVPPPRGREHALPDQPSQGAQAGAIRQGLRLYPRRPRAQGRRLDARSTRPRRARDLPELSWAALSWAGCG